MLGMYTHFNRNDHTVIDCEVSRFVSRLVDGDPQRKRNLFVVRYNKLGVFVIAEWLWGKEKGCFVDVMNLGKSLANFTRAKANELRRRLLAPDTASSTASFLRRSNSDHLHQLQDEDAEEGERLERRAVGE